MKRILFLAALTSCLSFAQPSRQAAAIATHKANTVWQFVEIETTVHRAGVETSSATKRLSIARARAVIFIRLNLSTDRRKAKGPAIQN